MPDSTVSQNPLSKYFRQPKLYIKLPSAGRWYGENNYEATVTGEVPVFAMTGKDELVLKNPDGLLNGQSTVDVLQSCIPNIKNAWAMPLVDLDAALIAIRQATYGNRMEFTSVCSHCGNKNESALDLGVLFSQIVCPDYSKTVKINKLEFYLKPQNYHTMNQASFETFEQQRLLNVVADDTLTSQEKSIKFNQLFSNLLNITVSQVASCVAGIKTEDGQLVENSDQIQEFFKNCDKTIWDAVKKHLDNINDSFATKKIPITCESCTKDYTAPLVFEQTNFFV